MQFLQESTADLYQDLNCKHIHLCLFVLDMAALLVLLDVLYTKSWKKIKEMHYFGKKSAQFFFSETCKVRNKLYTIYV